MASSDAQDLEWEWYSALYDANEDAGESAAGAAARRPLRSASAPPAGPISAGINSSFIRTILTRAPEQEPGPMANFNNFSESPSPGGPAGRPPAVPNTAAQLNGIGNARHWPDLGVQMDMNVLWEYVTNLSALHEGIRAQTQNVLHGVQQIQARDARGERAEGGPVGGRLDAVNGLLNTAGVVPQMSDIAALQSQLSTAHGQIATLTSQNSALTSLLTDYETSLSLLLDKLRPFAQQHAAALTAQKAHYLQLIEDERKQNLELRLEHQQWQQGLGRVAEHVREALRSQSESDLPWQERVAALKTENRSLRRLAGLPVDDSDDEGEAAEAESKRSQPSPEETTG